jgi:hypothetical protein
MSMLTPHPSGCPERDRLRDEYLRALDMVADCTEDMTLPCVATRFATRLMALRTAEQLCNCAREAWEEHLRSHLCCYDCQTQSAATVVI